MVKNLKCSEASLLHTIANCPKQEYAPKNYIVTCSYYVSGAYCQNLHSCICSYGNKGSVERLSHVRTHEMIFRTVDDYVPCNHHDGRVLAWRRVSGFGIEGFGLWVGGIEVPKY